MKTMSEKMPAPGFADDSTAGLLRELVSHLRPAPNYVKSGRAALPKRSC